MRKFENIVLSGLFFFTTALLASESTIVDQSLIVDKESALEFLKDPELKDYFFPSQARPGNCPFKSYNRNTLVMQLKDVAQALRNSRCDNSHRELISNLTHMAGVVRNTAIMDHGLNKGGLIYSVADSGIPNSGVPKNTFAGSGNGRSGTDAFMYLDDVQTQRKDLLHQLAAASEDEQCVADLHNAGLISSIADIAVSVGQTALFAPGPNGAAIALGTLSLAATLKVVSALLKTPYNWKLEKDRMLFLDLNCNFFDLRKELEEADFFDTKGIDKEAKANKARMHIDIFDENLAHLKDAQKAFEANVIQTQDTFLEAQFGKKKIEFYRLLNKAINVATLKVDAEAPENRYRITKDLGAIAEQLISLIPSEIKDRSGDYLIKMLKPFAKSSLSSLDKLKVEKLLSKHIAPLTLHLQSAHQKIEKEIEAPFNLYQKQVVAGNETNRELIERGLKAFENVIQEASDKKVQLLRRISHYEAKTRKSLFSSYDNGAHMDFDVLKEYQDSQNLILGKIGWGFLKYLLETGDEAVQAFSQSYKKWNLRYPTLYNANSDEVSWACRDANQLRVKWNVAFATISLANDFYETNKGILSWEYKKMRYFMNLIPYKRSDKMEIFKNIRSLEMAKSIIDGKTTYTRAQVKKLKRMSLGTIALQIKDSEAERLKVDEYFGTHNCLVHL